jgi:hypothetical protein
MQRCYLISPTACPPHAPNVTNQMSDSLFRHRGLRVSLTFQIPLPVLCLVTEPRSVRQQQELENPDGQMSGSISLPGCFEIAGR